MMESPKTSASCTINHEEDRICIVEGYFEQLLISDDERHQLMELCLTHLGLRVPVMTACTHFITRALQS